MEYPVIDMKLTGRRIKEVCRARGISVKSVQEYMNFSSVQSVYDWFHGKSLPSLDNFYALSRLLGMPMEDLIREPASEVPVEMNWLFYRAVLVEKKRNAAEDQAARKELARRLSVYQKKLRAA